MYLEIECVYWDGDREVVPDKEFVYMKKVMETVLSAKIMDKKVEAIMGNTTTSKSGKMKEMFNLGMEVKQIAELMGVRYNFVYNVVSNMCIVEGVQMESSRSESKKDIVWGMLDLGKTTKEIAIELKTCYNYVYKLKKEWEVKVVADQKELEAKDVVSKVVV